MTYRISTCPDGKEEKKGGICCFFKTKCFSCHESQGEGHVETGHWKENIKKRRLPVIFFVSFSFAALVTRNEDELREMPSTIRRLALTFFSDARLLYTQHASPFHLVMYARMNISLLLLYPSFTWRVRPYRMGTRNDFGNTSSADDFSLSFATSWRGRYTTCVCVRIDPLSFVSLSIMMPENPWFFCSCQLSPD